MYEPIHWTPFKRRYDRMMGLLMAAYLLVFCSLQGWLHPDITAETLLIRATATLAFLMLHLILCIGPLCRLDARFLPLLYNRRHLGVAMFATALGHGLLSLFQFHALGNADPLVSMLSSNRHYGDVQRFPFEVLGFVALLQLAVMAATSHDFWLNQLSPRTWKALHMGVYGAYALLVMHVMLGAAQREQSPVLIGLVGLGMMTVTGLHLAAARASRREEILAEIKTECGSPPVQQAVAQCPPGFHYVCDISDIPENKAKMARVEGQSIAIFKYDGQLSAVHNLCKHQNGPLSEGRIIDGCITCPWHGYQYRPQDGQSPPPFTEKLATYDVWTDDQRVYVHPQPYPEGTARPAAVFQTMNDE